jgi:regulator of cell morphogenesis and NO signaling
MIAPTTTLGELVVENPARSRVLEKFGLDYCCGGKATLGDACARKALPVDSVVRELDASDATYRRTQLDGRGPGDWSLTEIVDHIERTHHDYLRAELPRLSGLLEKVVRAHGDNSPYLHTLRDTFEPFRADLEQHMAKEEKVLFPWIRRNEATGTGGVSLASLGSPIAVMEAEHEDAGAALEEFRALTNGYVAPPTACGTFRALLDALATLEQDMHRHVHLENSVLFPRALGGKVGGGGGGGAA